MSDKLRVGKLNMEFLAGLLGRTPSEHPRLIVGPRVGEDAAVIDMGDRYLVAKADPITFATDEIGLYAVAVNANDIATRGARPLWFLATLLLPEGKTDEVLVEGIFDQIGRACEAQGIVLVGGHTEVTHGLDRPVLAGAMLGEVDRERLISTSGLHPGDHILLARSVPLEGCCLIAREKRGELLGAGVDAEVIERAAAFLHDPGISVTTEALAAADAGGVTSMHDPTEGGLATGLLEMATAARVGLRVERAAIPLAPGAAELCGRFGLDPLGTIASGALLIGVEPGSADGVTSALQAAGVQVADIGRAVHRGQGTRFVEPDGHARDIPYFEQDEIARLF